MGVTQATWSSILTIVVATMRNSAARIDRHLCKLELPRFSACPDFAAVAFRSAATPRRGSRERVTDSNTTSNAENVSLDRTQRRIPEKGVTLD